MGNQNSVPNDRAITADRSKEMAKKIPNSKFVLLPVVHLPNIESSDVFEKAVLDFLLEP